MFLPNTPFFMFFMDYPIFMDYPTCKP